MEIFKCLPCPQQLLYHLLHSVAWMPFLEVLLDHESVGSCTSWSLSWSYYYWEGWGTLLHFLTRTCFLELVWNWRWSMVASCKWGLLLWRSHGWMSPGLVGPQNCVFCVFHPVAKGEGTAFEPDVQPQWCRATFQHTFGFYVVQFWRDNKQQKVHKSLVFRKKTSLWQFISYVAACFFVYDSNSISWIVLKFINSYPVVTYRCCIPPEVSDLKTWDFSSPCCSQWCTFYQVRR